MAEAISPRENVRALQRALYVAAKRNGRRKFPALYDRIARPDVLPGFRSRGTRDGRKAPRDRQVCSGRPGRVVPRRIRGRSGRGAGPGPQGQEARGLGSVEGLEDLSLTGGDVGALVGLAGWAAEHSQVEVLAII